MAFFVQKWVYLGMILIFNPNRRRRWYRYWYWYFPFWKFDTDTDTILSSTWIFDTDTIPIRYFSLKVSYFRYRHDSIEDLWNRKPDFFRCLLVQNWLWPADFSIMYTCSKYKMFKITLHYREVSGLESVLNQ